MNLNTHPHPYGVFIGGNDMGTPGQTDLYCAAYGNGKFIVRGFGPAPFKMNGFLGDTNDAVHKAAGQGQPVSQDVALSVKGSKVECSINGTVVASYDKALLVTGGKLKSTDGTYGLRFAHNTDVMVTGLTMTKDYVALLIRFSLTCRSRSRQIMRTLSISCTSRHESRSSP